MYRPLTEDRLERVQAAMRAEAAEAAPEIVGTGAVRELDEGRVLVYRGRAYHVPPVPYVAALRLQELAAALGDVREDPAEAGRIMRDAVRIFGRLCRPIGPRRWLYRLLPNRFRHASPREVGQLLGFCLSATTCSRVRFPSRSAAGDRRRSTG